MTKRTLSAYKKWAPDYDSDPNPHILLEHDDFVQLTGAATGERILDAACGTGKYSVELVKARAKVTGIDFCKEMLRIARRKAPNAKFLCADITKKLPFKNQSFDKVICAQTLKHIKNLTPTLKEFNRVLKPAGLLIFSVTHPEIDWTGFEMRFKTSIDLAEESDIYHHKFQDYLDAFSSSKFKIAAYKQVPIGKKIKHLLKGESYPIVKGRYEVIIFCLQK